jgi:hypothetical protein
VTTKKNFQDLPPKKLREIWDKVTPADWLALLQEHKPNNDWTLSGKTIKGCCPYHAEQKPSFVISLDKRQAKCFGSCDKYIWNPIQFYADVASSSYAHALQDMQKRYNLRISAAYAQNAQKVEDNDRLKRALFQAMHLELTEALSQDTKPEYKYLHQSNLFPWLRNRKLPEETAHKWPVGVMPTRQRLMARMDEIGASDMKAEASAYLGTYLGVPGSGGGCEGWFAFFYCTSPTTIGRIKLRKPKDGKDVPYYFVDDPYVDHFGWFGLNTFPHLRGRLQNHPLYTLEGEMDVLALVAHQEAEGRDDIFSIATSGKGEYDVTPAAEFGFDHIRAIPDNDKSGQSWAVAVMNENERVDRVYRWTDPQVKDPDEAFRAWGFEITYDRLSDETNYPRNYEWCSEQLEQDLLSIDSADVRRRNEIAARYGQALHDDSERAAFLAEAIQQEGIDKELVIQDMSISEDSPEAFVLRLEKQLGLEYYFMHEAQAGTMPIGRAWSNRKKVMRSFQLNSPACIMSTLELDVGNIEVYIRSNLGEPDFLNYRMGPKGMPMRLSPTAKSQQVMHICGQATRSLASKATPKEKLKEVGQGVHYIDDFEGSPTLFIVNGTKFFKGSLEDDKINFTQLDCPISDDFIFRLAPDLWSNNIKTVDDIKSGMDHDPKELFNQVWDIMKIGWRFKHHDLESQFMAADIMYTSIASVFNHMVMTDLTGETHSGKTSLMQLMGGNEFGAYRLCDSAIFIDDFTAAAVRQLMSGHCLRLLLDEFEDTDSMAAKTDKKANAVRDILNMIRSLVSGARSIRGTAGGEHQDFHIKFPLTVGGIYTMREARDLNRFVHVRTHHMEGFNDPIVPIRAKYSVSDIAKIRRGLTLCWLPRVPELLQAYQEIQDEFADNKTLPPGTHTRLKDNLMPAAAIMKIVGHDYKTFMTEFCKIKMEELLEQGATKESTNIWSNILHTSVSLSHVESGGTGVSAVAKIIGNPNLCYLLNDADLGAYYLKDKKWLVVFWQKIVSGVLQRSNTYRGAQFPLRLKAVADGDPRVIPKEVIRKASFMKKYIWPLVGAAIGPEEISVLDVSKTLDIGGTGTGDVAADYNREQNAILDDIPDELLEGEVE